MPGSSNSSGFVPVRLDVKELRGAVENGTVDAQENPLTNTYNFDIHKHHRYITLSGHFFGVATLLCHNPTFQAWPVDASKSRHGRRERSNRRATPARGSGRCRDYGEARPVRK